MSDRVEELKRSCWKQHKTRPKTNIIVRLSGTNVTSAAKLVTVSPNVITVSPLRMKCRDRIRVQMLLGSRKR